MRSSWRLIRTLDTSKSLTAVSVRIVSSRLAKVCEDRHPRWCDARKIFANRCEFALRPDGKRASGVASRLEFAFRFQNGASLHWLQILNRGPTLLHSLNRQIARSLNDGWTP